MKVKTLRRHSYDRKIRAQGDIYGIENQKHVRLLEAVKKIERIPEILKTPVTKPEPNKRKSKRKYKRKDMTAETPKPIENRMSAAMADDTDTDKV